MTCLVPWRSGLATALLAVGLGVPWLEAAAPGRAATGSIRRASSAGRPDLALYREAQAAEKALRASARRQARRAEWEAAVVAYRRIVARFPRSGYCDNALFAIGGLYRDMSQRFRLAQYRADAIDAYRMLVSEYPSSSLGDDALWYAVVVARDGKDQRRLTETARAYLDTYPEGRHVREVRALLKRGAPSQALPAAPPPGLAHVFDVRSWSGESSTRVVIDLARRVPYTSDVIQDPDRLWIDLVGTRVHPNLAKRVFPVGDGLLEQVRLAKNREDVVRIVLDFRDVWEHQIFYLDSPTRLVIDVRGGPAATPPAKVAATPETPAGKTTTPPTPPPAAVEPPVLPSAKVVAGQAPAPPASAAVNPITIDGVDRLPPGSKPPARQPRTATSEPPAASRPAVTPPPSERRPEPPAAAPEPPAANRAGSYSLARQLGLGARRIVIDAGHGGHDPGTIGRGGLQEKDLVLDVALRLADLVRQELGTEVVLTRSTDVFVPLEERTAIANSRGADLFLSIHANSSRNPKARGIETYFLNFARNAHAEAVAARENAISAATIKDLQNLVKAITLSSKIDESRDFAASVQEGLVTGARSQHPVPDRGVHTAPFYVLIGANMPAVLAEIAFLSNPEDEKRLRSPAYRNLLARSLLDGVRRYLESLNRTQMRQLTRGRPRTRVTDERRSGR